MTAPANQKTSTPNNTAPTNNKPAAIARPTLAQLRELRRLGKV